MKTGTFLDLDMTSLGQNLGDFWRWWASEISAMMPAFLQTRAQKISGQIVHWQSDGALWFEGAAYEANLNTPTRAATIVIPQSKVLVRSVEMPALSITDLRKIVMLDLDRLMPFPPGSAYADVQFSDDQPVAGKRHVNIAAIPKDLARSIDHDARSNGLLPKALGVVEDGIMKFDFVPALQSDGSAPPRSNGSAVWWGVVTLLFALNLGLFIYLDQQRVDRMTALVDSQSLSAVGARKVANRIAKEDQLRADILAQRSNSDPLAQLALTTRQMPPGVWVQRYSASANVLRMAGYKQSSTDLLGTLRKSGRFSTIRATTAEGAAESGTGQPFDVTAEIKRK